MVITVRSVPILVVDHAAHTFALVEHARLYASFQSDRAAITGQEAAVVAYGPEGDVIGVIAWEKEDSDCTAWVALVAVAHHQRRRGVFAQLWSALAREVGCVSVRLGAAVDNTPARAAYESVGLRATFVIYEGALA